MQCIWGCSKALAFGHCLFTTQRITFSVFLFLLFHMSGMSPRNRSILKMSLFHSMIFVTKSITRWSGVKLCIGQQTEGDAWNTVVRSVRRWSLSGIWSVTCYAFWLEFMYVCIYLFFSAPTHPLVTYPWQALRHPHVQSWTVRGSYI